MIRLGGCCEPPHLATRPGGFSWWYVDIVGPPGEGVVLIWSRSLPFVPAEPGAADTEDVSVVIAVYRDGREHFYALQCEPCGSGREEAAPGELRVGRSRFCFERGGGRARLRVDIDLDVPGSGRVVGEVEVAGPETLIEGETGGELDWRPIAVSARGRASLRWAGGSATVEGRAYFDGNAGDRALGDLAIDDWRWGRIAFPRRDVVYFLVASPGAARLRPVVLVADGSGRAEPRAHAEARFEDGIPGWFGLRRAQRLRLSSDGAADIVVDFTHQVEDGPFYQRYLLHAHTAEGEAGYGVAERVVPARLAEVWHEPLVRMRVNRVGSRPSMWFPLFSGPVEGRWNRLLAYWLDGRGARSGVAS